SSQDGSAVWQVVPVSARVQVIDAPEATAAGTVPVRVARPVATVADDPRTPPRVDTTIDAGTYGRSMVLAEAADSRWTWRVDGASVTPVMPEVSGFPVPTDPALQSTVLADTAVPATVSFDGRSRTIWLWVQAVVVFLVLLLALPSRRAEDDDDSDTFGEAAAAADTATSTSTTSTPDPAPDAEPVESGRTA
ncbi:MAG TPA: hypothetical protein VLV82_06140, partial [Candidatus Angelobacter sp.]|nr:hypothetical protein [Candidatus Angelobacter sp.]